jgi:mRNA interferase RelE/StbE
LERYKIKFSKRASKDYKRLPKTYKALIDNELSKFVTHKTVDIKPVLGKENCYRIRVGKYRILLIKQENILIVTDIGTRGDIYN